MNDPRNPKRPTDDAGANWAECKKCRRAAIKITLIRRTKKCPSRPELAELSITERTMVGIIEKFNGPAAARNLALKLRTIGEN
jgi:hypothetical protein